VKGIDGRMNMDIALAGTWKAPSVSLQAGASKLSLQWPRTDIDLPPPVFEDLQLSATYEAQLLQWQFSCNTSGDGMLRNKGTLPWLVSLKPWAFSAVENKPGRVDASLQVGDLSSFQPWLPRLYPLIGNASVQLDVRDPLGQMQTDASLNIAFTALGIPELGLDMQGQALADWQENRGNVDIAIKNGDGTLTMQGPVTWPPEQIPTIHFNQFPAMQLPDQQVIVDGHLDMFRKEQVAWIKGQVTASKLSIEIPETQPKPTADLVWTAQEETQVTATKLPLTRLDVTLNLGEAAEIYGRGMKMQLAGQ